MSPNKSQKLTGWGGIASRKVVFMEGWTVERVKEIQYSMRTRLSPIGCFDFAGLALGF